MARSLLDLRPAHVRGKLENKSKICLLSSRAILTALKDEPLIVMACNTRIRHVIPGIMRAAEDLDAIVAFEIAKSEGGFSGYTGFVPKTFWETVIGYAQEVGYTKPFFIHGDHITVKNLSPEEQMSARELIGAELDAGFTSFCIDPSFNEICDNIRITTSLAKPLMDTDVGLEVEVGEITHVGKEGRLTSVEEAVTFVSGLVENGIRPNLLAIYNGSKHGNYRPGETVHIDLKRTQEVADAIRSYDVRIAQHGITGTPVHLLGQFADHGIRKGNVGTNWQNVAHANLPKDLLDRMKKWAEENGKDIKEATKPFLKEIHHIPKRYIEACEKQAYREAKAYIEAFRAKGSASLLAKKLLP